MKLTLLTYNIHKGFNWKNSSYILHQIKETIHRSGADIAFLQEVVGQNERFQERGMIDRQFEYLADSLWSHFSYAQNAVYDHGHHGNLILSKFPIEKSQNIDLSTNRWEQRGLLMAKILIPSLVDERLKHIVNVGSLHLNLLQSGRQAQYKKMKEYFSHLFTLSDDPYIIAGDFNDWNKKACLYFESDLQMKEAYKACNGRYAKTFPGIFPILSLDRIYVKNLKIQQAHVLSDPSHKHLSDHLPLVCEVTLET